jgi:hypothetical protein
MHDVVELHVRRRLVHVVADVVDRGRQSEDVLAIERMNGW